MRTPIVRGLLVCVVVSNPRPRTLQPPGGFRGFFGLCQPLHSIREAMAVRSTASAQVPGFSYHTAVVCDDLSSRLSLRSTGVLGSSGADRSSLMLAPPDFDADVLELLSECVATGLLEYPCDRVQFLVYPDGVGFAAHHDSAHRWGPRILSLSLGATCELQLSKKGEETFRCALEDRSVYILKGAARYDWKHAISRRKRGGARLSVVIRTTRLYSRAARFLGCGREDWTDLEEALAASDDGGRKLTKAQAKEGEAVAVELFVSLTEDVFRMADRPTDESSLLARGVAARLRVAV